VLGDILQVAQQKKPVMAYNVYPKNSQPLTIQQSSPGIFKIFVCLFFLRKRNIIVILLRHF
jgi:hypothetical protein